MENDAVQRRHDPLSYFHSATFSKHNQRTIPGNCSGWHAMCRTHQSRPDDIRLSSNARAPKRTGDIVENSVSSHLSTAINSLLCTVNFTRGFILRLAKSMTQIDANLTAPTPEDTSLSDSGSIASGRIHCVSYICMQIPYGLVYDRDELYGFCLQKVALAFTQWAADTDVMLENRFDRSST